MIPVMDASYPLTDVRSNLDKVVDNVRHGGKTVQITDHGTPVAAVIPMGLLDYFQQLEDDRDFVAAEGSKAGTGRWASHVDVAARFGPPPDGTPKK